MERDGEVFYSVYTYIRLITKAFHMGVRLFMPFET